MRDFLGSSTIDRVIALRSFPGYASLPLEEVEVLAAAADDRRVEPGEYVFQAGEVPKSVFFVTAGRLETCRNGRKIRDFGPGSAVGGLAALGDSVHGYDCVATESSTLIVLKVSQITDIFDEHFEIVRSVLTAISGQMLDLRRALAPNGGYPSTDWKPDGPPPPRMNLIERLGLLRRGMQFAGSRLEALADLARQSVEVRLEAGDVLWREDQLAESFVFIVWGTVKVENTGVVQARFGPGDVVGFLGPFSGRPRWYTAHAETPLVGLRLSAEVLLDVCEDHPDLAMEAVQTMATGLLSVTLDSAAALEDRSKEPTAPQAEA